MLPRRAHPTLLLLLGVLACASAEPQRRPALTTAAPRPLSQRDAPTRHAPSTSRLLAARTAAAAPGCSVSTTVVQIVNNVAGAGILTLAAGMAAGVGWAPAILICAALGAISGYTFYLIGAACESTGESSFKGLWGKTLGARTAWIVDGCIALMCLSATVIYSGILGDVFSALLRLAGVPNFALLRTLAIIGLTVGVLTPLSLLEDLSALSFTSALGCGAIVYTAIFVITRALDGTYHGGNAALLASLPAHLAPDPSGGSLWKFDNKALVLVSNLGLAFIAHYNAPAFYQALEGRSKDKFAKACTYAFAILTALYTAMMGFGYKTFGGNTASNLLLNYAEADPLAVLGRLATGVSILFGYPLGMVGLRTALSGMCATLAVDPAVPSAAKRACRWVSAPAHRVPLILGLLTAITLVACTLTDIGVVVGVSGALLGAAIVYVIPPLIYGSAADGKAPKAMYALVPLGVFLGVLGTTQCLAG